MRACSSTAHDWRVSVLGCWTAQTKARLCAICLSSLHACTDCSVGHPAHEIRLIRSSTLLQLSGAAAAPGGALLPRLLRAAVGLLDEGGLEARTAGKRMLWALRRLLDGGPGGDEFKRALARLDCKTEKVCAGWDAPRGAGWSEHAAAAVVQPFGH